MASSIVFAYIRTFARTPYSDFYIPMTNMPAVDLALRPEFSALLPRADIEPSDLITLDDLPSPADHERMLRPGNTDWILVDHNAFQEQLGQAYRSRVTGVIDHHEDEGLVPMDTGDEPRIIEKSGSCASLVTEHCKNAWDELSHSSISAGHEHAKPSIGEGKGDDIQNWDAQLAKLALGAILIDTANLKSEPKVTPHDVRAVEYLESMIRKQSPGFTNYERDVFYREINAAKRNIDNFSTIEILRKDYKEWTETGDKKLGISSVVRELSWLSKHAEADAAQSAQHESKSLGNAILKYAESRNLSIYAIMTTSKSPQGVFQRELFVWARDPECVSMLERFHAVAGEELGLEEWQGEGLRIMDSEESKKVWRQKEVGKSRKQVAPLLRRCMNEG